MPPCSPKQPDMGHQPFLTVLVRGVPRQDFVGTPVQWAEPGGHWSVGLVLVRRKARPGSGLHGFLPGGSDSDSGTSPWGPERFRELEKSVWTVQEMGSP